MEFVMAWLGGAIAILLLSAWIRGQLKRHRHIDVGTVSESWIAQHRTSPIDSSR
jgi:hypothetical protein